MNAELIINILIEESDAIQNVIHRLVRLWTLAEKRHKMYRNQLDKDAERFALMGEEIYRLKQRAKEYREKLKKLGVNDEKV